jgi:hypothetical protein
MDFNFSSVCPNGSVHKSFQGPKLKFFLNQKTSKQIQLRALDEIDAGIFDSWTYAQIAEKYPEEFLARSANKLVTNKTLCFFS